MFCVDRNEKKADRLQRMNDKNPWPKTAKPEQEPGMECIYSDHTGLKMYDWPANTEPKPKTKGEK